MPLWDNDFWWHISTGRYIYENRLIPQSDPFSFTSKVTENKNLYPEREGFILRQYWLAQVVFYLIFEKIGPGGIVILRNIILLSCLVLIFFYLYYRGIDFFIVFLVSSFSFLSLLKFTGERPVLFTIFFSLLSFVILDLYISKRHKFIYLLPIIFLLWANCHGGFILGDLIIILLLIGEGIKFLFRKSLLSQKEILTLYSIGLLSIIISGLNPAGFKSFFVTFSPEYLPFTKGIQEYIPPVENIYKAKLTRPDYGYLLLLFLGGLILILRNIKFDLSYFILLLFLVIASLKAMRFSIYFSLISSIISAIEFNRWLRELQDKRSFLRKKDILNPVLSTVLLVSLILFLLGFEKIKFSNMRFWVPDIPLAGAAEFIEKNLLKGNMLNSYASGGYLAWRFYPRYETFIDSRGLNLTVMAEYGWIFDGVRSIYNRKLSPGKKPLWKRLLDYYNINFIVFELENFGTVPQVFFELLEDSEWVPVYIDVRSIVFVRDIKEHKEVIAKHKKTFNEVMNFLIVRSTLGAINQEYNPRFFVSLGECFTRLNRFDDAITAYKYALKRMPGNENIKKKIEELERKKEEMKNEE